ncbi:MAG: beta-N-acetylhexosaminidase [Bacilli bacterium]
MQITPKELQSKILNFINNFYYDKNKIKINLTFEKQEGNLKIVKNDDKVIITYQFDNQIYHATSLVLINAELKSFQMEISPKFKQVGVMLDVARNAVPKIETLKHYIVILAALGYSYLGLYLEDVFQIENEENYGYMRGRYTSKELKELDLFASEHGIELVPFIQTLAHLKAIFRHREYGEIHDIDDILLTKNDRTHLLLDNMLNTISKTFKTKRINIGMDEAWQLGLGKYLKENGYTNKTEIMQNHLKIISKLVEKYNFKAEMWADMFFVLAGGLYNVDKASFSDEIKKSVPEEIKLIYWDYDNRTLEEFQSRYNSVKELTDNYGFAGGAHKWVGFAPKNHYAIEAISNSTKAAINNNVNDYLLTAWGDNGGEASHFSIMASLIYLSSVNYSNLSINNYKDQFSAYLTNYKFNDLLALDLPNILYDHKNYKLTNPSKYLLYEDVLMGSFYYTPNLDYQERYNHIKENLIKLAEVNSKYNYLFKTLGLLAEVLENKSTLTLKIHEAYKNKDIKTLTSYIAILDKIINSLDLFKEAFKKQWHKENKTFGFEIQSYRLGGLKERLFSVKKQLNLYISGKISKIEVLDERKMFYNRNDYNETLYLNIFTKYISPSDI